MRCHEGFSGRRHGCSVGFVMTAALAVERLQVEFQGALVKLKLFNPNGRQKGKLFPYDHMFKKVFNEAAKGLPEDKKIRVSGRVVGVDFTEEQLLELHAETARRLGSGSASCRGRVVHFSAKSRKRLLEVMARMRKDLTGLFMTFTYRRADVSNFEAKKHLDLMLRWLKYNIPDAAFIWRLEYQERGTPHFHVIVLNVKRVPLELFKAVIVHWRKVSADDNHPDIKTMQNKKHAMFYVSKYIAKRDQASPGAFGEDATGAVGNAQPSEASAAGLDYVPYSEKSVFVGRFWGIVNRKNLPLAERIVRDFNGSALSFLEYRRLARSYLHARYARSFNEWQTNPKNRCYKNGVLKPKPRRFNLPARLQGFTIFVENSEHWLSAWERVSGADQAVQF